MVERRSGLCLSGKAIGESLVRDFDGDLTAKARVACAIYATHPTGANERHDLVRTEAIAWSQSHTIR
jgi:hypothetical protein